MTVKENLPIILFAVLLSVGLVWRFYQQAGVISTFPLSVSPSPTPTSSPPISTDWEPIIDEEHPENALLVAGSVSRQNRVKLLPLSYATYFRISPAPSPLPARAAGYSIALVDINGQTLLSQETSVAFKLTDVAPESRELEEGLLTEKVDYPLTATKLGLFYQGRLIHQTYIPTSILKGLLGSLYEVNTDSYPLYNEPEVTPLLQQLDKNIEQGDVAAVRATLAQLDTTITAKMAGKTFGKRHVLSTNPAKVSLYLKRLQAAFATK